jgi:hypothetical protein
VKAARVAIGVRLAYRRPGVSLGQPGAPLPIADVPPEVVAERMTNAAALPARMNIHTTSPSMIDLTFQKSVGSTPRSVESSFSERQVGSFPQGRRFNDAASHGKNYPFAGSSPVNLTVCTDASTAADIKPRKSVSKNSTG